MSLWLIFRSVMMIAVLTEPMGHLGLVSAVMQDLGIMEKVDGHLGEVPGGVGGPSYGQRVGAMILNGLGFTNKALYLTPHFFRDKPVHLLLGDNVIASQLNDDALGRCLDKIASYGTTKLFSEVAMAIAIEQGVVISNIHLDSTSLSLYGSYEGYEGGEIENGEKIAPVPCQGYSKDHRPDLKQVVLQMAVAGEGSLPIWMEALDGNSSDKKSFPETVQRISKVCQALKAGEDACFIADSALYSAGNLEHLEVDWITRVPETSNEAKSLCSLKDPVWESGDDPRYQWMSFSPFNPKERWLLVRSEPAFLREKETFFRKLGTQFDALDKTLWHLGNQQFACRSDAEKHTEKVIKPYRKFFEIDVQLEEIPVYAGKGRPAKNALPDKIEYRSKTRISSNVEAVRSALSYLGRFILATNQRKTEQLSNAEMLFQYKEQHHAERGFRFIKNDAITLDSVYLKSPARIGALMMIMTLCLMVYNFAQHRLRKELKKNDDYLPNQKEKPTQSPDLLWIFSLFSAVSYVTITANQQSISQVSTLIPLQQKIVAYFGNHAKKIYAIPPDIDSPLHIRVNPKNWFATCGM